ncbi:hypothetical protein MSPP1_000074 [Malassezia sp. CBS 17886]|nr:hypothetical protein MSPP1_000074 [Malassezia sp. CBS 17886]
MEEPDARDSMKARGPARRNRVHFACTECYRRKQRCNRKIPCQHCIARRIPEQCRCFQQQDNSTDVSVQLARLERVMEDGLSRCTRQIGTLQQDVRFLAAGGVRPPREERRQSDLPLSLDSYESQEDSDAESDDQGSVDLQKRLDSLGAQSSAPHMCAVRGEMPQTPQQVTDLLYCSAGDTQLTSASESLSTAMKEALEASLYPRAVTEKLMDVFINTVNVYRYPLPSDIVVRAVDAFYSNGGNVTPASLTQFGLVATASALALLFIEDESLLEGKTNGRESAREASWQLCNAAQIACFTAHNLERTDINLVLTHTLVGRLLFVRGCIKSGWTSAVNAVGCAYSLGLHRDGDHLGLDAETTEERRRVWGLVYTLERFSALAYGQPVIIWDAFCDTRLPRCEGKMEDVPEHLRALLATTPPPSVLMIARIRQQIAHVLSGIALGKANVSVRYAQVRQFQHAMNRLVSEEMPFYLRIGMENGELHVDSRLDEAFPFLKMQRNLLWFDLNFLVLVVHCPFLLRSSSGPDGKYALSYATCLERVQVTRLLRRAMSHLGLPPIYVESATSFRWFNDAVIAGFLLLKRPPAADAHALRQYMSEFVDWRSAQPVTHKSRHARQDLNIVRAMLQKAAAMHAAPPEDPGVPETPNTSASEDYRGRIRIPEPPAPLAHAVHTANGAPFSASSNCTTPTTDTKVNQWGAPQFIADVQAAQQDAHMAHTTMEWPFGVPDSAMAQPQPQTPLPSLSGGIGVSAVAQDPMAAGLDPSVSMITPNIGLDPQTLMPMFPINPSVMPNMLHPFQADVNPQSATDVAASIMNMW